MFQVETSRNVDFVNVQIRKNTVNLLNNKINEIKLMENRLLINKLNLFNIKQNYRYSIFQNPHYNNDIQLTYKSCILLLDLHPKALFKPYIIIV